MKIAHVSPQYMVIVDRPWLLAGFVWAVGLMMAWNGLFGEIEADGARLWLLHLLFVVLGTGSCAIAWFAFPFQRIIFDRTRGELIHRSARPLFNSEKMLPLAQVSRAKVEKIWGESTWMERAALEVEGEAYPLEWGYCGTPRGDIVAEINRWLRDGGN